MKTPTNERMASFIEAIANQAKICLHERSDDMLKAWQENIAEAHENEKDFPPLKVGIAATVDLEENTVATEIRFTVTYKSKLSAPLPDPNQPDLVAKIDEWLDHKKANPMPEDDGGIITGEDY